MTPPSATTSPVTWGRPVAELPQMVSSSVAQQELFGPGGIMHVDDLRVRSTPANATGPASTSPDTSGSSGPPPLVCSSSDEGQAVFGQPGVAESRFVERARAARQPLDPSMGWNPNDGHFPRYEGNTEPESMQHPLGAQYLPGIMHGPYRPRDAAHTTMYFPSEDSHCTICLDESTHRTNAGQTSV